MNGKLLHFHASPWLESKALSPLEWLLSPKGSSVSERVLARLIQAEAHEQDPWMRDDIRIAWIATLYASQGNPQPHIDATYRVLGLHPDKVWPAICARRAAILGNDFGLIGADAPPTSQSASNFVGELSPKKPCAKVRTSERRAA